MEKSKKGETKLASGEDNTKTDGAVMSIEEKIYIFRQSVNGNAERKDHFELH